MAKVPNKTGGGQGKLGVADTNTLTPRPYIKPSTLLCPSPSVEPERFPFHNKQDHKFHLRCDRTPDPGAKLSTPPPSSPVSPLRLAGSPSPCRSPDPFSSSSETASPSYDVPSITIEVDAPADPEILAVNEPPEEVETPGTHLKVPEVTLVLPAVTLEVPRRSNEDPGPRLSNPFDKRRAMSDAGAYHRPIFRSHSARGPKDIPFVIITKCKVMILKCTRHLSPALVMNL